MKITGYTRERGMIKVTTDSVRFPEFVYFDNKFNNIEDLKVEMRKKIAQETKMDVKRSNKIASRDLDNEIGVDL